MRICDDLRQSVLQAAIQGKLTKQLPEDGNASDLLKQTIVEKERLIKEKKIKKEKLLPEISPDEIPFDIPENWQWVRLGDILSVFGGKRIPVGHKLTDNKTEHKYITVSDMQNGTVLTNKIKYVPDEIYNTIKKYTISFRDVYITVAGTIGRIGEVPKELDGANLTENADKLVFGNQIDKYWLIKALQSSIVQKQITEATTKVGQPKLAIKRIELLIVPLPPLAEQHRIVARVNELMSWIDDLEKTETELEKLKAAFPDDMKAALLQAAMQGKLTEQLPEDGDAADLINQIVKEKSQLIKEGKIKKEKPLPVITSDEMPFDIPENWQWVRLGNCGYTNIGLTYKPNSINAEGTIVLRSNNIQNGKMDYSDLIRVKMDIPENKICKTGDILICARNGSKKLVGKSAIIDRENMSFGAFMAIFRTQCNYYINYLIQSPYFRKSVLGDAGTTTINQLTQDMLKNFLCPLPPLAEQKRIVEKLDKLLPLCDGLVEE